MRITTSSCLLFSASILPWSHNVREGWFDIVFYLLVLVNSGINWLRFSKPLLDFFESIIFLTLNLLIYNLDLHRLWFRCIFLKYWDYYISINFSTTFFIIMWNYYFICLKLDLIILLLPLYLEKRSCLCLQYLLIVANVKLIPKFLRWIASAKILSYNTPSSSLTLRNLRSNI
jgi:hypothetical protein